MASHIGRPYYRAAETHFRWARRWGDRRAPSAPRRLCYRHSL